MSDSPTPQEVYRALQRRARNERRGTQELFEFYLLERFLYRLSISRYHERFVLKGGLLLTVLGVRRPTRDADMLARAVPGDEESLLAIVREVASIPVDDGIAFEVSQTRSTTIREHAAYPGTRIVVPATLGTARLRLRLDVNFGDPAHARRIAYPTLLSDEPFGLLGYPVETVIAEKVETMISRGDANTRERDYADVLALSKIHPVEASALRDALERTAVHRGTNATHAAVRGSRNATRSPSAGLASVPRPLQPAGYARQLRGSRGTSIKLRGSYTPRRPESRPLDPSRGKVGKTEIGSRQSASTE